MEGLKALQLQDRETTRPAQAYLLVGEGGAEVAEQLIKRLIEPDEAGAAKLARGVHPDVRWVTKGKRLIGIDQIRLLQEDAIYPPSEAKRKVYVLAEAEALSPEAANSLLRVLEEPPSYLVFLLLARGLDLLPTIISRCRVIRLEPKAPETLKETLRDHFSEEEAAYLLAATKGLPHLLARLPKEGFHPLEERARLREQLVTLEDQELARLLARADGPLEVHEVALELFQRIPSRNSWEILSLAAALSKLDRPVLGELLREAVFWFRDLLLASTPEVPLFNTDQEERLREATRGCNPLELAELTAALEEARRELEGNANLQLLLEAALLKMKGVKT
ncbi:MAG: DNA polymerase III subunit [Candidatus Bipolaricaulia bacterium]